MACGSDNLKCAPMPLVRDWQRVHVWGANEVAPGRQLRGDFRSIEPRQGQRFAHVRAIQVRGYVRLDVPGATNDAVSAYTLRKIAQDIRLQDVAGHAFIDGADGRDLVDDAFFDGGAFRQMEIGANATGVAKDRGVGKVTLPFEFTIDCAGRAPGASQTSRLILAAALQGADAQALEFRLLSGAVGTGVAVDGFFLDSGATKGGLEMWADVVNLDAIVKAPRYGLRAYFRKELSGAFDHPDATHEYVIARYRGGDATGDTGAVATIDGVSIDVGGHPALKNIPAAELATRDALLMRDLHTAAALVDSGGETIGGLPQELATGNNYAGAGFLMLLPPRARQTAPAGRITYRFRAAPTEGVRVLHRFVLCDQESRERAYDKAAGVVGQTFQVRADGAIVQGVVDPAGEKFLKPVSG